ncbi:uncharacterized protein LOC143039442 [Oratosquilla oratoria]|uniref:uncharacterized protein LOC143039442 n=1 Tax=Oratosquilla oratoria TaxID=337810 RepID=UPI003F768663
MGDCQCKPPVDHRYRKRLDSHHYQRSHHHRHQSHHLNVRHHHTDIRTTVSVSSSLKREQVPRNHRDREPILEIRLFFLFGDLSSGSPAHSPHRQSFPHHHFHQYSPPIPTCTLDKTSKVAQFVFRSSLLSHVRSSPWSTTGSSLSSSCRVGLNSSTTQCLRSVGTDTCRYQFVVSILLIVCTIIQVLSVSHVVLSSFWHDCDTIYISPALVFVVVLIVIVSLKDCHKNCTASGTGARSAGTITCGSSKKVSVAISGIKVLAPVGNPPSSDLKKFPSSDLKKSPSSDLKRSPSSDLKKSPSSDLKRSPSSDLKKPISSDLKKSTSSNLKKFPSSDLKNFPSSDLPLIDNCFFILLHFLNTLTILLRYRGCVCQHEARKLLQVSLRVPHLINQKVFTQNTWAGEQRVSGNIRSSWSKNKPSDNPNTVAFNSFPVVLDQRLRPRVLRRRSLAEICEPFVLPQVHYDWTQVPAGTDGTATYITSDTSKRIQTKACLETSSNFFEKVWRIARTPKKIHKVNICVIGDRKEAPMSQKLISRTIYTNISRKKPLDTDDNYLVWFNVYLNISCCLLKSLSNLGHRVLVPVISSGYTVVVV